MRRYLWILLLFNCALVCAEEETEQTVAEQVEEEEQIAAVDNLGPTAAGFLPDTDFGPQDETFLDRRVLRDFIESRGLIECRKKEGNLTIASDVRARWLGANEDVNGFRVRGTGTNTAINRFKSEINLFLDYVAPTAWVSTKLRWVNFDGVDGGTPAKVSIDRAFIGYDVYHEGTTDFYIEIGRSRLNYMFESRVQFTSVFDGIHIYYTRCIPGVGTAVIHGGPFIIDSFTNDYAWVVETGVDEWAGTGFSCRYSLIDWHRHAPTEYYGNLTSDEQKAAGLIGTIIDQPRYSFIVSQMLMGYQRKINFLGCKTFYVYGAVLLNHDPKRSFSTNGKKLNQAWYAGFTLGKLCKACDWSIDFNYQSVQAQSVPEFDLSGVGHGNAANTLLSDAILLGLSPFNSRGFTNYKGFELSLLYAMTDSLSLRSMAQWTRPRNKSVGGSFDYRGYEMSVIYAY